VSFFHFPVVVKKPAGIIAPPVIFISDYAILCNMKFLKFLFGPYIPRDVVPDNSAGR
jgi:hypothetical protein